MRVDSKLLHIQIVKGQVADYAIKVADCQDVKTKELAQVLKEIAEELEK